MLPKDVQEYLAKASESRPRRASSDANLPMYKCEVFNSPWDQFVELWAPRVYYFLENALGTFHKEPLPVILKMPDGQHSAGATASFEPGTGQVRLASSVEGKPGQTLEKLCHEFTHASLANFPEGDPFYEEGFVDYCTYLCAHAPAWEPYRQDMIAAAELNIRIRRDRALQSQSDYCRKRYSGGLYAMIAYGPHLVANLRLKKMEGNLTW